jgi:hypothetical protein
MRYGRGTAARNGMVRLPGHVTADFSTGLSVWQRENLTAKFEFNLFNVMDSRYQIAKESEETPIQYSSPAHHLRQNKIWLLD